VKKKLLIINPNQFGYYAGYYYYCKYLKDKYDITFVCLDRGLKKIEMAGVAVKYLSFNMNKIKRLFLFITTSIKETYNKRYDLVFTVAFKFCFLIGMFSKCKNVILDIRTGSLSKNSLKRKIDNNLIFIKSLFFKKVTILSESLRERLKIRKNKTHILPLGSEIYFNNSHSFNEINLLYVGTLNIRNIDQTVEGFARFCRNFKYKIPMSYKIIGFGKPKEEAKVIYSIKRNNLSDVVQFLGRKNYNELKPYFDSCNIGVSYIPITDYFQCQPATKTFEYILSGMVCIATKTYENSKLINNRNGVLCDDTPESFARALEQVYNRRDTFHSDQIRNTLKNFTWENIVENNLKMFLKEVVND